MTKILLLPEAGRRIRMAHLQYLMTDTSLCPSQRAMMEEEVALLKEMERRNPLPAVAMHELHDPFGVKDKNGFALGSRR